MKKLRHPNVVLFMGFCSNRQTGEPMYMVFEYLERGSLWGIIHNKSVYITQVFFFFFLLFLCGCSNPTFFVQPMRVKMAQDIARGLYYLHSLKPPILHRDIKYWFFFFSVSV
jgi:serine/threonine-protein kinase CTR1